MKKIVVLLLVCCLLAGGVFGFLLGKDGTIRATPKTAAPVESAAPVQEAPAAYGKMDYEAIYALHDPEEVVMTVAGQDIPWSEYYYYLYYSRCQRRDRLCNR